MTDERVNDTDVIREEEETNTLPEEDTSEDKAVTAAYEAGRAEAMKETDARITELENKLKAAQLAAARRETEIRCGAYLRERGLSEEMTSFLLAPGEAEVEEEILIRRVEALSGAVEAAAMRELQSRAVRIRPEGGKSAPLTGAVIRDMPIARLAELMG
ncbi:MAG: hypothetical protein IJW95_02590 [Clostridia bacterium]|nr:hypothetical protein [Clostridia bacterium]